MFEALGVVNVGTFLLGTIAIIVTPGPSSLYVLSIGTRFGRKAGYQAVAGIMLGDAVLIFLASAGVAAALAAWPVSFNMIRLAGAAYLAWIGLRILLAEASKHRLRGNAPARTTESPFRKSLLIGLSNPNTIIFYISFFVQFVNPQYAHKGLSFFVLACIIELTSFTYLSLLIAAGSSIAVFFQNRHGLTRFFRCLLGVLFLCFGLRLALVDGGV